MDLRDLGIGWAGQKAEQLCRYLALLQLAHLGPFGADAREEGQGAILAKREPNRMVAGCARAAVDLGKAGEGDEAAMLHPEPASPMGRSDIANIGDAGIGAAGSL